MLIWEMIDKNLINNRYEMFFLCLTKNLEKNNNFSKIFYFFIFIIQSNFYPEYYRLFSFIFKTNIFQKIENNVKSKVFDGFAPNSIPNGSYG